MTPPHTPLPRQGVRAALSSSAGARACGYQELHVGPSAPGGTLIREAEPQPQPHAQLTCCSESLA